MNNKPPSPSFTLAILTSDTLSSLGLANLLRQFVPFANIQIFADYDQYAASALPAPCHVFVSSQIYTCHATDMLRRRDRVVVLVHGQGELLRLPCHVHTLNVCLPHAELVKAILALAHSVHNRQGAVAHGDEMMPQPMRHALNPDSAMPLTPRQVTVLSYIAKGMTNKQIAEAMGIAHATVLTHRKNIIDILNIRSVSALTIYAIIHGIVRAEEV